MNMLKPTIDALRLFIKSKQVIYVLAAIAILALSLFSTIKYRGAPDNPAEEVEEEVIKDVFNLNVDLSQNGK